MSFVPIRALALHGRGRQVRRLKLPRRFERELVVAVRRQPAPAAHILGFIENVLF